MRAYLQSPVIGTRGRYMHDISTLIAVIYRFRQIFSVLAERPGLGVELSFWSPAFFFLRLFSLVFVSPLRLVPPRVHKGLTCSNIEFNNAPNDMSTDLYTLTPEQLESWKSDGFLYIKAEDFWGADQIENLKKVRQRILTFTWPSCRSAIQGQLIYPRVLHDFDNLTWLLVDRGGGDLA